MVAGGTDATRIGDYRVWPAVEFQVTGASLGNAVVRPSDQRMTRMEALRSYTLDSAWLAFDDDDRGSLEEGKLADLAVLDAPYLRVPGDADRRHPRAAHAPRRRGGLRPEELGERLTAQEAGVG